MTVRLLLAATENQCGATEPSSAHRPCRRVRPIPHLLGRLQNALACVGAISTGGTSQDISDRGDRKSSFLGDFFNRDRHAVSAVNNVTTSSNIVITCQ